MQGGRAKTVDTARSASRPRRRPIASSRIATTPPLGRPHDGLGPVFVVQGSPRRSGGAARCPYGADVDRPLGAVVTVLDRFRLDDKVAIVTGASSGLGVGFAVALAEAGADVVLAARRADRLAAVAVDVEACGRRVLTHTT